MVLEEKVGNGTTFSEIEGGQGFSATGGVMKYATICSDFTLK